MSKFRFARHIWHYGALLAVLILGFFLTMQTASDKTLQLTIVLITTLFYIIWGLLHHLIEHDLTARIVVEYVLIGSLGASIVLFILLGT